MEPIQFFDSIQKICRWIYQITKIVKFMWFWIIIYAFKMLLPAVAMIRETSENSPTYLVHDSLSHMSIVIKLFSSSLSVVAII